MYIRHPNGIETLGEVLEVREPERISFTYGFVGGKPMPPGASRVTIRLEPDEAGTRLHLQHEFAEANVRDEHVQGWRFQLSLFGLAAFTASAVEGFEVNLLGLSFGINPFDPSLKLPLVGRVGPARAFASKADEGAAHKHAL